MRIGFCGSGGTGKTTTAQALAEKTGIPFIPSPSRMVFEKFGVKTEDDQASLTAAERLEMQFAINNAIWDSVEEHPHGIFDRTHLDNYFYMLLNCRAEIRKDTVLQRLKTVKEGLRKFNMIIYCPIYEWGLDGVEDGMRTQQLASRYLCASFIRDFLHEHLIGYSTLPGYSLDTNLEIVWGWVTKAVKNKHNQEWNRIPDYKSNGGVL